MAPAPLASSPARSLSLPLKPMESLISNVQASARAAPGKQDCLRESQFIGPSHRLATPVGFAPRDPAPLSLTGLTSPSPSAAASPIIMLIERPRARAPQRANTRAHWARGARAAARPGSGLAQWAQAPRARIKKLADRAARRREGRLAGRRA